MENGVYTSRDRDNAQMEANALMQQIDKIAETSKFNGVNLLDGSYNKQIRAGNTNAEVINVYIDNMAFNQHRENRGFCELKKHDGGANVREINRLTSFEAGQVSINTSLFSDAFKEVFQNDGLGKF